MAVKAYIGQPRSGKSYEVVLNFILNALTQGRRVVSNIAGLNYEAMVEYLIEQGTPKDQIGQLVCVTHDQILQDNFFRTDKMTALDESFIQPGDAVALDEIWRFWEKRKAVPAAHMNFFRMHGHMVHPDTGLTIEIALLTQLMRDFHPDIKGIINETYWMVKKVELGKPKMYTVHVYERDVVPRDPKKDPGINTFVKTYDPAIFPMYKSHSMAKEGQAGVEQNIDKRGSMFAGKLFKIGFPLAVLAMAGGVYNTWKFFHPETHTAKAEAADPSAPASGVPVTGQAATVAARPSSSTSSSWRVAGLYGPVLDRRALLVDSSGRSRIVIPKTVAQYGSDIRITLHFESGTFTSAAFHSDEGLMPK